MEYWSATALKQSINKRVLTNFIRHADTHNRVQEEQEMWRLRELERRSQYERVERPERGPPLARGRLVSDTLTPPREDSSPPSNYYWTRQLMKAEENDPFRWGHSGYKELYPDEFVSMDEEGEEEQSKKEKKRRKKSRNLDASRKKKHDRHTRKQRKKATRGDNSSSETARRLKKKKRRKKDVSPEISEQEESTDSGSSREVKPLKKHRTDEHKKSRIEDCDRECSDLSYTKTKRRRKRVRVSSRRRDYSSELSSEPNSNEVDESRTRRKQKRV